MAHEGTYTHEFVYANFISASLCFQVILRRGRGPQTVKRPGSGDGDGRSLCPGTVLRGLPPRHAPLPDAVSGATRLHAQGPLPVVVSLFLRLLS